jgi:diguanylate cyclase (GGDEF)-like protein/PAS domain S-box-containing protein
MPAHTAPVEPLSALLWQATLEHAFDAIVLLDIAGAIVEWSPQAERCFGWFRDEALGVLLHELVMPPSRHPAHMQWLGQFIAAKPEHMPHGRLETMGLHRTGHLFPVEMAVTLVQVPQCMAFLAIFRDISERRSTEDASRIAAAAFETLEGMVVINAQQIVVKVNEAFTRITGYGAQESVGKRSSIFRIDRHDEAVFHELRRTLPLEGFWQGEVWDRRKNGESFPVWLRVTAVMGADKQVNHYVAAFVDNTQNRASEERIHHLAFYDTLTSLPNRRLLMDRLKHALAGSVRKHMYGAVLLVDMDDFKDINDALGHEAGDLLLVQVGQRLRESLHADDTMARVGGDEFAVILPELGDTAVSAASKAETVAERMRATLIRAFDLKVDAVQTSPSIGIAIFFGDEVASSELLKRAETAMYRAKSAGRNCIRFFDAGNQTALERRFMLTTWMRQGLPAQFALHYQLQVDQRGQAIGAEALLRWQHPQQGPISPAMFIPLAEETGFIVPLGTWVLQTACQQLQDWTHHASTRHLTLAVNVSARQFHAPGYVDTVLAALASTGAPAHLLKLELTEGLMLHDVGDVIEKMHALKRTGVSFSIDDFGTGYSSLSYLKRLPLDQLKIDQSFVRDLLTDPNDVAIANTIIGLGHSLGLTVIAEGVETAAQHKVLLDMHCDAFQGYFFGRPVTASAFLESLGSATVKAGPQTGCASPLQPRGKPIAYGNL